MTAVRRWFNEHRLLGRVVALTPFSVGVFVLVTFLMNLGILPGGLITGALILGLFFGVGHLMNRYAGKL